MLDITELSYLIINTLLRVLLRIVLKIIVTGSHVHHWMMRNTHTVTAKKEFSFEMLLFYMKKQERIVVSEGLYI